MAAMKSSWTLIASEPGDSQIFDRNVTDTSPVPSSRVYGHTRRNEFTAWRTRHSLLGWKFGVQLGLLLTVLIFILNVCMTGGVVSYFGMDEMGKASLITGPCDSIKRYNTAYHLFINVLSTLLIGASNYTMQMLSAPTRSEIDKAHAKGKWLDIGVPSWRNLKSINQARVALWIILSFSSVPLHLFFNSAVFVTLYQHSYHVAEVGPSFFQLNALDAYTGTSYNIDAPVASSPYSIQDLHDLVTNRSSSQLTRVDTAECIKEATVPMNTQNLLYLLVTKSAHNKPYNTSDLQYKFFIDSIHTITAEAGECNEPGQWACGDQVHLIDDRTTQSCELCWTKQSELLKYADDWRPNNDGTIDYCLNLRAENQCALEFNIPIMVIICVMNLVKVLLFAFIGFLFSASPIVTLGDAVASFIGRPSASNDPSLEPQPYNPGNSFTTQGQASTMKAQKYINITPTKKLRRWTATTKRRWTFAFIALLSAEFLVIFWLIYAAIATRRNGTLFEIPFATVDPRAIIYTWKVPSVGVAAVIENALIANIAQPMLSAIYFAFNGLCTAMVAGSEWNSYALQLKGLRVSGVPIGAQRSTHFLQLPYKYGVPLMLLSILTHWMVSQAIFVVSILNDGNLNLAGQDLDPPYFVTCGYSPTAIIGVIALGACILLYTIGIGVMPLKSVQMPIAGSNSMLIEKQCALEVRKYGLEKMALQWGIRPSIIMQHEYVAGFSDMPVNGGEKELEELHRRGYQNEVSS